MTHIIFVHGMNADASSWGKVPEDLRPHATSVETITLKGHDTTLHPEQLFFIDSKYDAGFGMEGYVESVTAAFPADAAEKVCLVGHSMGGAVISHVAAAHPDRVERLIYVAAMLPDGGDTIARLESRAKTHPDFKEADARANFLPHFGALTFTLQPREPLDATFTRTTAFEAIPRAYIRCTGDGVLVPAFQDEMLDKYAALLPATETRTLATGHLPQLATRGALVATLKELMGLGT